MNDLDFVNNMKQIYPMVYESLIKDMEADIKRKEAYEKNKRKK